MHRVLLAAVVAALFLAPTAGAWTWPVHGPVVQPFVFDPAHPYAAGQHRGIDIGAAAGAASPRPRPGRSTFAGTVPASGKSLTITTRRRLRRHADAPRRDLGRRRARRSPKATPSARRAFRRAGARPALRPPRASGSPPRPRATSILCRSCRPSLRHRSRASRPRRRRRRRLPRPHQPRSRRPLPAAAAPARPPAPPRPPPVAAQRRAAAGSAARGAGRARLRTRALRSPPSHASAHSVDRPRSGDEPCAVTARRRTAAPQPLTARSRRSARPAVRAATPARAASTRLRVAPARPLRGAPRPAARSPRPCAAARDLTPCSRPAPRSRGAATRCSERGARGPVAADRVGQLARPLAARRGCRAARWLPASLAAQGCAARPSLSWNAMTFYVTTPIYYVNDRAAHRPRVHDDRGRHPQAPSPAARRGDVLPHRRRRARDEGLARRRGAGPAGAAVRRSDRRGLARAAEAAACGVGLLHPDERRRPQGVRP